MILAGLVAAVVAGALLGAVGGAVGGVRLLERRHPEMEFLRGAILNAKEAAGQANHVRVQLETILADWPAERFEQLDARTGSALLTARHAKEFVEATAAHLGARQAALEQAVGGLGVSVPRTRERV